MPRTLLCLTLLFSSTAIAGEPSSRGPLGVYATRPLPSEEELAGGAGGSDSAPPWAWPTPELLEPDTGVQGEEELLGWLVSGDDAQRAEAQIRLLPLGEALLPRLEVLALGTRDDEARSGLLQFLQVLTTRRVHPDRLGQYPELSALAAKSVARGQELVARWEVARPARQLVEQRTRTPCGVGPPPESELRIEGRKLQELRDKLRALGGLALPGVERMMASPSATTRLQGITLASVLELRPSEATLARLRQDPSEVKLVARSTLMFRRPSPSDRLRPSKVTLSEHALMLTRRLDRASRERQEDEPAALRAGSELSEWLGSVRSPVADGRAHAFNGSSWDLTHGLRTRGALEATDVQMYWNRVRPLWRLWWKTVGSRSDAYDRQRWLALTYSADGFQLRTEPRSDGKTVLRVAATSGVEAELVVFSRTGKNPVVVEQGTLPLTHTTKEPVPSAGLRLRVDGEWIDSGIFVTPPKGEQMTIWVQPELFRRYLKEKQARR
ncbi:hypothetical protein ACLESO_12805 [Pyxidicoccus sp. 3LG]